MGLTDLKETISQAKLEQQIIFLELLGGDIDDAVEHREDAAEFWNYVNDSTTDMLAYLVGVKSDALTDHLQDLWYIASEHLDDIEDSIQIDLDTDIDLDAIEPEAIEDLLKDL